MQFYLWLFILITNSIFVFYCKEFTLRELYSLRIGNKETDIDMLIDNTIDHSILYSNTDGEYAHEILTNMEMDLFNDTIEINGLLLKQFIFKVESPDKSIHNNQIQGILGLGINEYDRGNTLFDALLNAKLINTREIYLTTYPSLKLQFRIDIPKAERSKYTTCKLTDKEDLNSKYRNGWICEFTHLMSGQYDDWNQTFEIHGRAIFDTSSLYINAPKEYYEYFVHFYSLDDYCNTTIVNDDDDSNHHHHEMFLKCNFTTNTYDQLKDLYFIFDGIAYHIPGKNFFKQSTTNNSTYDSLIKFTNEEKNIWIFGYPFLSKYSVMMNFDEELIGFKGGKILNFTYEWLLWKEENESFLTKVTDEKFIMFFLSIVGSIILIIFLMLIIRGAVKNFHPPIHSQLIDEEQQKKNNNN